MKSSFIVLAIAGAAVASPFFKRANEFIPPTSTDRRSPCPMVNALANHGYLPRNGLNISMADLIVGFKDSVNLANAATQFVGAKALSASRTGNPSTIDLDDLNTHNILEHDGSLSRADIHFGDNHSFNSTIFDTVAAFFTGETIDIPTATAARKARLTAAAAENPEFNMPAEAVQNSFVETALYMSALGDGSAGVVPTKFVLPLFREERLPVEEGWTKSVNEITAAGVGALVARLRATNV